MLLSDRDFGGGLLIWFWPLPRCFGLAPRKSPVWQSWPGRRRPPDSGNRGDFPDLKTLAVASAKKKNEDRSQGSLVVKSWLNWILTQVWFSKTSIRRKKGKLRCWTGFVRILGLFPEPSIDSVFIQMKSHEKCHYKIVLHFFKFKGPERVWIFSCFVIWDSSHYLAYIVQSCLHLHGAGRIFSKGVIKQGKLWG